MAFELVIERMLPSIKKNAAKKSPMDLLGLDFGYSGLKVVRIKKVNGVPTVVAADILPPVVLEPATDRDDSRVGRINFPKEFLTNYAAMAFTADRSVIRVVSLPGHQDNPADTEKQIRENIGIDSSFRVSFIATPSKTKGESRMLTVAVPDADITAVLNQVSQGAPAPFSLEVSGLAAMNACLRGPAMQHANDAICVIECGARSTMMAIMNKGSLVLARKLEVGGEGIITTLQRQLGVDRDMAQNILSEGSIDISQTLKQVIEPFLRQLTISRDFVERQENCRISNAYISGGMSLSVGWREHIERVTSMTVKSWNPFDGLSVAPNALSETTLAQSGRFAAAVGAAMGVLETS